MSKFCFALCTYKDALNILLVSSVETSTSSITSESPIQAPQITSKIPLQISTGSENEKTEDQHTTPSLLSTSSNISKGYTDITTTNAEKEAEMTSEYFGLNSSPIGPSTMKGEKTTLETSSKAAMAEITVEASTEKMDRQMDETSVQTTRNGHSTQTLGITTFPTTPQIPDKRGSELSSTQYRSTETPKSDLSTENRIERTFGVFTTEGSSSKNSDNTLLGVTSQAAEVQTSEVVSIESYTTEKSILHATTESPMDKISQLITTEAVSKPSMDETSQMESTPETTNVGVSQPVSTDTHSTESGNKPILQETSMSPSQQTSYPGPTESPSAKSVDLHRFPVTSQATDKETSQLTSLESHSTDFKENLIPKTTSVWSMGTISQTDTKESSSTELVTKGTEGEVTRTMFNRIQSTISGMYESATTERAVEEISQTATTDAADRSTTIQLNQMKLSQEASTEGDRILSTEAAIPQTTSGISVDKTSQPETSHDPSTAAMEKVLFKTSSETTGVATSDAVWTQSYSTKPEHKPLLELTTPQKLMDETSRLVTMESSSTKVVDKPMSESTSEASSLETSQPASTESRSTKSVEELPSKVTSGPDNLETSGPLEFTRGVTTKNVHTPDEGNFLINELSPHKY